MFFCRYLSGRAAAVLLAGALLCVPFRSVAFSASLSVQGLPPWLVPSVERSLGTVWEELSARSSRRTERERVLRLVAGRLYPGYRISALRGFGAEQLEVTFVPSEGAVPNLRWDVRVLSVPLSPPLNGWLDEDARNVEASLMRELEGVPPEALGWGDLAFRKLLEEKGEESFPGWHMVPVVRLQNGVPPALEITLTPKPPFVLILLPAFQSQTLPVILRQDLKEGLLKDLSPLIGLPVPWVRYHKARAEIWVAEMLEKRNVARRADAELEVDLEPDQLSRMRISVESPLYVLQGWVAGYAGSDSHYPEVGLHLGRQVRFFDAAEVECYGEWVMQANDFELESRWGLRMSPWEDVFLGAELSWPGEELWWRLWADSRKNRVPYLWWRYNPEGEHNGGLGWRINEHFSVELYYDERRSDTLSFRVVGNL